METGCVVDGGTGPVGGRSEQWEEIGQNARPQCRARQASTLRFHGEKCEREQRVVAGTGTDRDRDRHRHRHKHKAGGEWMKLR